MPSRRWVRIAGDGLVYSGPCLVHNIIFHASVTTYLVDIYDGRDAVSGKKFCRLDGTAELWATVNLGEGAPFDVGVYVDAYTAAEETTIVFTPLGE